MAMFASEHGTIADSAPMQIIVEHEGVGWRPSHHDVATVPSRRPNGSNLPHG